MIYTRIHINDDTTKFYLHYSDQNRRMNRYFSLLIYDCHCYCCCCCFSLCSLVTSCTPGSVLGSGTSLKSSCLTAKREYASETGECWYNSHCILSAYLYLQTLPTKVIKPASVRMLRVRNGCRVRSNAGENP